MATPADLLTSKIPPHSLEAERAVLGGMLLDRESLPRALELLKPFDFYKEDHRTIFGSMLALFERHEPVDLLTVSEELKRRGALDEVGGPAALGVLAEEAATLAHMDSYASLVRDKAALRSAIQIGTNLIGCAYDNGVPPAELVAGAVQELQALSRRVAPPGAPCLLGEGLGIFLARTFVDEAPLVEGLLTTDGNGWIAGEEKLGKTYFALEEALALALGQPVAGRFPVPERRRVLFIEEEDPPRRAHVRLAALLRGRGLNPDDPFFQDELDDWFKVEIWAGFSLDDPAWIARLDATCAAFRPAVVYLDVLRKLTQKDLNKASEAGALLATLDDLRRRHGVIFRILHHYRKSQGFRVSRGSQEMGGSFVLGAWGECSLFFEPLGRKQGGCRVDVQVKDGPPVPSFKLGFYAEEPKHAPTLVRLTAEDQAEDTSADDVLRQAVETAPKTEAVEGNAGVSVTTLAVLRKRSEKTIRRGLKRLLEAKLVTVCGAAAKGKDLYAVAK